MSGEVACGPVANPYAPGAGTPPPALVGRDTEREWPIDAYDGGSPLPERR